MNFTESRHEKNIDKDRELFGGLKYKKFDSIDSTDCEKPLV